MKGKGAYNKKFHEMSVKQLVVERNKLEKKLYGLKIKNSVRGLKETHKITNVRKNIARVHTILKSKIKENYGDNMK